MGQFQVMTAARFMAQHLIQVDFLKKQKSIGDDEQGD